MMNDIQLTDILKQELLGIFPDTDVLKLSTTKPIDQLPQSLRTLLVDFYKAKKHEKKLFACLLNSLFSEKKLVFTLSRSILHQLISQDENIPGNIKPNGKVYGHFVTQLTNNAIVKVVYEAPSKPTLYQLQQPKIIQLFLKIHPDVDQKVQLQQARTLYCQEHLPSEPSETQEKSLDRDFDTLVSTPSPAPVPFSPKLIDAKRHPDSFIWLYRENIDDLNWVFDRHEWQEQLRLKGFPQTIKQISQTEWHVYAQEKRIGRLVAQDAEITFFYQNEVLWESLMAAKN